MGCNLEQFIQFVLRYLVPHTIYMASAVLAPYRTKDESVRQRESPDWLPHEAYLLASPFNHLERISVIRQIETPVERLIDRALSMSVTSPEKLGSEQETLVENHARRRNATPTTGSLPKSWNRKPS